MRETWVTDQSYFGFLWFENRLANGIRIENVRIHKVDMNQDLRQKNQRFIDTRNKYHDAHLYSI